MEIGFELERALLWIVLLPLAGAFINGVFGRNASRATVHTVAVGAVAISFALGLIGFIHLMIQRGAGEEEASIAYTFYHWFSITAGGAEVPIYVRFVMDPLSAVMTLVVTGVGLLIHIYACGYMAEDPDYSRFFSYLNLFMASMLVLVLGSNLPLMFIGWEGVGLCSYLLIGFWFENANYAAAGRKAFVTNRIGDFGVLLGMFLLVQATGSFEFAAINAKASSLGDTAAFSFGALEMTVATAASLFLFLGCTGKSAQIPLFVWLPDAMAGPTPVSALIHAATMVTSGVYLVCRLSPVFAAAPGALAVIAVTGALTALVAATIALVQNNMKRVLAYSTVSQLGFMFAAVGCGAFAAGIFHVYTHAFFKACLFLGAGSVMHAVGAHGDADIRQLGGLRKFQPTTHWTFLVSCLAIAGFPLFSGFFSKDEILVGALSVGDYFSFAPWLGYAVFAVLVIAATMTAFYMFRLYFVTFWNGEYRGGPAAAGGHGHGHGEDSHGEDSHGHHDPHESPESMTMVLSLLAIGALVTGYLWVGLLHHEPWVEWLEPSLGTIGVHHRGAGWALLFGTGAALTGIIWAYRWYFEAGNQAPARLAEQYPGVHRFLMDKWRVDEFYDATVLRASRGLGMVSAQVDKNFVDGILAWVTSQAVSLGSFLFTRIQNGLVHAYGAFMMAGIAAVAWWFLVPHPFVGVNSDADEIATNPVKLEAGSGIGYQYRWDFDSDGNWDTEWSSNNKASHSYTAKELVPGAVLVVRPGSYGFTNRTVWLSPGEQLDLNTDALGKWQRRDPGFAAEHPELMGVPPYVKASDDTIVVRPNGALVRYEGNLANGDEEIRVRLGHDVIIGDSRISVAGWFQATVKVKNALGMERSTWTDIAQQKSEAGGVARAGQGGGR